MTKRDPYPGVWGWSQLADEGSHNRMVDPVKDRELVREIVRTGKLRVWN